MSHTVLITIKILIFIIPVAFRPSRNPSYRREKGYTMSITHHVIGEYDNLNNCIYAAALAGG